MPLTRASLGRGNFNLEERVQWVRDRLEDRFGPVEPREDVSPLDTLLRTVLSQNTNDANRDRAWDGLKEAFEGYREIDKAPLEEIAEAIRPGGLHQQKARTIKDILATLRKERGSYSLDYLRSLSTQFAVDELMDFHGVGKKTAAVVVLFAFGKPYFPVDTHVRRVSQRLGLIEEGDDPHRRLNELVPDPDKYQLHLHLIRHGRETCKARRPRCRDCVLLDRCPHGQSVVGNES